MKLALEAHPHTRPVPARFVRADGSLTPAGERHQLENDLANAKWALYRLPFQILSEYGKKRSEGGWTQEGAFALLDACLAAIDDPHHGVVFNWAFCAVHGTTHTWGRSQKHLKKVFRAYQKTGKIDNTLTHAELSALLAS